MTMFDLLKNIRSHETHKMRFNMLSSGSKKETKVYVEINYSNYCKKIKELLETVLKGLTKTTKKGNGKLDFCQDDLELFCWAFLHYSDPIFKIIRGKSKKFLTLELIKIEIFDKFNVCSFQELRNEAIKNQELLFYIRVLERYCNDTEPSKGNVFEWSIIKECFTHILSETNMAA